MHNSTMSKPNDRPNCLLINWLAMYELKQIKGANGQALLQMLEMRLDHIVLRLRVLFTAHHCALHLRIFEGGAGYIFEGHIWHIFEGHIRAHI